ncbi:hypothetical protein Tco_1506280 [Tanacetum coccineum]
MSSSSTVTYTSVYTDSEPGRVFWGANEELSDGGSPRVILYGYNGLPMQQVTPPYPDYMPGHEHPPSPVEVPYVPEPEYPEYLVPSNAEAPLEDQYLPTDASPTALSPGYMADSYLEEDPEEDHTEYPADEGDGDDEPSDDDDDDDDTDDEDEDPIEDEDDDEEEEHLAPVDSSAIPIVDPVPSAGDKEAFETDESAPTHVPSPRRHMARMSVRPIHTNIVMSSEAKLAAGCRSRTLQDIYAVIEDAVTDSDITVILEELELGVRVYAVHLMNGKAYRDSGTQSADYLFSSQSQLSDRDNDVHRDFITIRDEVVKRIGKDFRHFRAEIQLIARR